MGCMSSRETRHPQSEIPRLCFFDVQIGGEPAGRLVVELQHDLVPLTCANFRALCSGAKGWGYKGTKFHRIIPGTCVQGGNCGESIYGKYFKDESFKVGHLGRGTVYMANEDEPDTNASQFFICLAEKSSVHLKHVAFGRVLSGLDVVDRMEACGVSTSIPAAFMLEATIEPSFASTAPLPSQGPGQRAQPAIWNHLSVKRKYKAKLTLGSTPERTLRRSFAGCTVCQARNIWNAGLAVQAVIGLGLAL